MIHLSQIDNLLILFVFSSLAEFSGLRLFTHKKKFNLILNRFEAMIIKFACAFQNRAHTTGQFQTIITNKPFVWPLENAHGLQLIVEPRSVFCFEKNFSAQEKFFGKRRMHGD